MECVKIRNEIKKKQTIEESLMLKVLIELKKSGKKGIGKEKLCKMVMQWKAWKERKIENRSETNIGWQIHAISRETKT